jgi:probable phosphoglycerate mutase
LQWGGEPWVIRRGNGIELSGWPHLYLIRHGETAWSITGQHTGLTDIALTAHGQEEARALGPFLRNIHFTRVLTSPLLRARQTCDLAGLGAGAEIEPDLAEWNYGDYEGRRTLEIHQEVSGWNVWRDGCPHGETPANICARADRLLGRLRFLSGIIALVSHGQFGAALAARWIGLAVLEAQHLAIGPASIGILECEAAHPHVPVIALWNSGRLHR